MKNQHKLRPRIMLPRNLTVTKVKPNAKGKGTYNRQQAKRINHDS